MKGNFDMRKKSYSLIDDGRRNVDSRGPGSSQSPPSIPPQSELNSENVLSRRPSRLSLQLLGRDNRTGK